MTGPTKSFHVGIAVYEGLELMDFACIDLLAGLSYDFIMPLVKKNWMDKAVLDMAPSIQIDWIYSKIEVIPATAGLSFKPTTTYRMAERNLDLLLVPGCPIGNYPEDSAEFLKEAAKHAKVVMSTCGGSIWLGSLGILDGKKATTNANALAHVRASMQEVDWQDGEWVSDENYWTSGGAGHGFDMMATWIRETFPLALADQVIGGFGFPGLGLRAR
ncbi:class I glutamine amidotransferase-like protein, partial [Xylaria scruposa]